MQNLATNTDKNGLPSFEQELELPLPLEDKEAVELVDKLDKR